MEQSLSLIAAENPNKTFPPPVLKPGILHEPVHPILQFRFYVLLRLVFAFIFPNVSTIEVFKSSLGELVPQAANTAITMITKNTVHKPFFIIDLLLFAVQCGL